MYIVQTVHAGLMLDEHCADCIYRNVQTGIMLDVHCADCTYRTNVRYTLFRLYIQD